MTTAPPGIDWVHPIPCPARVGPKDIGPLGVQPPALVPWVPLLSIEGWFSNIDVYFEVPATWGPVGLRLFSVTGTLRSLIVETTIAAAGLQVVGGGTGPLRGIALSGRGHPGSGWIIEAANTTGFVQPIGTITAELWGTESTPEGVGNTPARTIPDQRMASRAAHLMGWPFSIGAPGNWVPIAVDASGGIVITSKAPRRFLDLGTAAASLISIGASVAYSLSCENKNAADRFIQIHNRSAVPIAGDVPVLVWRVPAGTTVVIGTDFLTLAGVQLPTGLAVAFSTTEATYTPAAAADQVTQVMWQGP